MAKINISFIPNKKIPTLFTLQETAGLTKAIYERIQNLDYLYNTIVINGGQIDVTRTGNGYFVGYLPNILQ